MKKRNALIVLTLLASLVVLGAAAKDVLFGLITWDGTTVNIAKPASTTSTFRVGTSLELGHADDTTLARTGAGVVTIEGVTILTTGNITSMDIEYDASITSDNTYSGSPITGINAGEDVVFGNLVYYDTTALEWMLADADQAGEAPAWGMAVSAGGDGEAIAVLQRGIVVDTAWDWTPGQLVYLSATPGAITTEAAKPNTATNVVQPIGRAITATKILLLIDPVNGYYIKG